MPIVTGTQRAVVAGKMLAAPSFTLYLLGIAFLQYSGSTYIPGFNFKIYFSFKSGVKRSTETVWLRIGCVNIWAPRGGVKVMLEMQFCEEGGSFFRDNLNRHGRQDWLCNEQFLAVVLSVWHQQSLMVLQTCCYFCDADSLWTSVSRQTRQYSSYCLCQVSRLRLCWLDISPRVVGQGWQPRGTPVWVLGWERVEVGTNRVGGPQTDRYRPLGSR